MQIKSRGSECRRNKPNPDWTRTYSRTIAASITITVIPRTIIGFTPCRFEQNGCSYCKFKVHVGLQIGWTF
ncbi:MAG: hypothetical protein WCF23_19870 [Candidatus Nitrosopolaris sp.]